MCIFVKLFWGYHFDTCIERYGISLLDFTLRIPVGNYDRILEGNYDKIPLENLYRILVENCNEFPLDILYSNYL